MGYFWAKIRVILHWLRVSYNSMSTGSSDENVYVKDLTLYITLINRHIPLCTATLISACNVKKKKKKKKKRIFMNVLIFQSKLKLVLQDLVENWKLVCKNIDQIVVWCRMPNKTVPEPIITHLTDGYMGNQAWMYQVALLSENQTKFRMLSSASYYTQKYLNGTAQPQYRSTPYIYWKLHKHQPFQCRSRV